MEMVLYLHLLAYWINLTNLLSLWLSLFFWKEASSACRRPALRRLVIFLYFPIVKDVFVVSATNPFLSSPAMVISTDCAVSLEPSSGCPNAVDRVHFKWDFFRITQIKYDAIPEKTKPNTPVKIGGICFSSARIQKSIRPKNILNWYT